MQDNSVPTNDSELQHPQAKVINEPESQILLMHIGAWHHIPPFTVHSVSSQTRCTSGIFPVAIGQRKEQYSTPSTINDTPTYASNKHILSQTDEIDARTPSDLKDVPGCSGALDPNPLKRWLQETPKESPLSVYTILQSN